MSCPDGSCFEPMKRRRALIVFGLMMLVFIMLSGFSFLESRAQVTPDLVSYATHPATEGKRVFQAYNCMGCHTLVGNGAYFAPDLTKVYELTGPAWLAAFLPSAGSWPTDMAIRAQLLDPEVAADAGVSTIDEYYAKFPGAKSRTDRRGGTTTYMPNLPFRSNEVGQLIAYLKYASAMDTEGWPPEIKVKDLDLRVASFHGTVAAATAPVANNALTAAAASEDPVVRGKALATTAGCVACHSAGTQRMTGPGWGGLHNAEVRLTDGTTVIADEAYLKESIVDPNIKICESYQPVMTSYERLLSEKEIDDLVKYIQSL